MSGRLIILPKKSWNVWNQDNVEKVLRDERLHREAQEQEQERLRRVHQEETLVELKKRRKGSEEEEIPTESVVVFQADGHINLFSEAEEQQRKLAKNKEYELEKQQRELLEKRRAGVAPWALGEGTLEQKKIKPWYHYTANQQQPIVSSRGEVLSSAEATAVREREDRRKVNLDPMAGFLHKSDTSEQENPSNKLRIEDNPERSEGNASIRGEESEEVMRGRKEQSRNIPLIGRVDNIWGISERRESTIKTIEERENEEEKERKRKKKSSSKHKHKHSKKSKTKKSKDSKKRHKRSRSSSSSSSSSDEADNDSNVHSKTEQTLSKEDQIALLRKRRMEREKQERRRAASLLAEMEMGGPFR